MKAFLSFITALVVAVSFAQSSFAAEFHVTNASELQAALNTAAGNGEADAVYLGAGEYTGSFGYDSMTEGSQPLTVSAEPGLTADDVVLNANSAPYALYLSNGWGCGGVVVHGITFKNAVDTGLFILSGQDICQGSIQVTNVVVRENAKGLHAGSTHTIIIRNSYALGNANVGFYASLISSAPFGGIEVVNNVMNKNRYGGLYIQYTNRYGVLNASITNNTFARNHPYGARILNYPSSGFYMLHNNIFWNNGYYFYPTPDVGKDIYLEKSRLTYSGSLALRGTYQAYNNIYTNALSGTGDTPPVVTGVFNAGEADNSSAEPQFVDGGPASYLDNAYPYDFHLTETSPAIDSGTNAASALLGVDKDGKPRIVDGDGDGTDTVDRGAYEFELVAPDLDGDGIANAIDGHMNGSFVDESTVSSNQFTDQGSAGGTTFGIINSRDGLDVTVAELGNPQGVRLEASGGTGLEAAEVTVCDFTPSLVLTLPSGASVGIGCGSLTAQVYSGPITITLGSVVITAPSDVVFTLTQDAAGGVEVANSEASQGDVTVDENGQQSSVGAGETSTYEVFPDCNANGIPDLCDIDPSRDTALCSQFCTGGACPTETDCNGNMTPDSCEADTDDDGTIDDCELCDEDPLKLDPGACGCGVVDVDTDSDGAYDCEEECINDPLKQDPGVCGCGTPDIDSDSDGTMDCEDQCPLNSGKTAPGVCGCEMADDADGDGFWDCEEQCPSDPNKQDPGVCGCGSPDIDTDDDGFYDCQEECPNDPNKQTPGGCGCGVADVDSDDDGYYDCEDQCPNDPDKQYVGACGCGVADLDANENGTADCLEEVPDCSGECSDADPTYDEDGDGVANCQEIIDGTDACDPGSYLEHLDHWACAGVNGFWGQINIGTIISHRARLRVIARYRNLRGSRVRSVEFTLGLREKRDLIVNELGLEADSYGTFCVYTDAAEEGAWSGGITTYKPRTERRRRRDGMQSETEFDFALHYPFTTPRTGTSMVSLNTYAINSQGTIANWVRVTDAEDGDGKTLAGVITYYGDDGQTLGTHPVVLADGGRFDFPGHEVLGQSAVGTAEFTPDDPNAGYFIESTRYHYEGAVGATDTFFTGCPVPIQPLTSAEITSRVSTRDNELAIIEILNGGANDAAVQFSAYGAAGQSTAAEPIDVAAKGTVHRMLQPAELTGTAGGSVGSFGLSSPTMVGGAAMIYAFGSEYQYAYASPFASSAAAVQYTEYNSFIGHKNRLVLSNSTDSAMEGVKVAIYQLDGSSIHSEFTLDLAARATESVDLASLPADTYGVIEVNSGGPTGLVVRNEVTKTGEYVLIFPGR